MTPPDTQSAGLGGLPPGGPSFVTRLDEIRRRVRRRLVAYGVCAVVGGGVLSWMTLVTLDWLVKLPAALRILGGVFFLAGFVGAFWHWVVRPLRARVDLEDVSARLERHFPQLQDRLVSAVSFHEHGSGGSASMTQRVFSGTEDVLRSLPVETALSVRPVLVRGAWMLAGLAALGAVFGLAPGWTRTGFYRYVTPLTDVRWPRRVEIVPVSGTETVALGESVTLAMRLARGWTEGMRAVVRLREAGGEVATRAMQRDRDGTFYAKIDSVTEDLAYWFEAGDDSTQELPLGVKVVRRPEVVEALATAEPPAYAVHTPPRTYDLREGPVPVTRGGFLQVDLTANKALAASDAASPSAALRLSDDRLVPLVGEPSEPRKLTARMEIVDDVEFRAELRDEAGFENRAAPLWTVRAVSDAPPTVDVEEPAAFVEVTPHGSVTLVARVGDDFGVVRVLLEWEKDGGSRYTQSLTQRLVPVGGTERFEGIVGYDWSLTPLALAAGDVLSYIVAATDNYQGAAGDGQVGRSTGQRIRIISDAEFEMGIRDDLAGLERLIRALVLDEEEWLDRASALADRAESGEAGAAEAALEESGPLSQQQLRLLRHTREIAGRLERVFQRIAGNRRPDDAGARLVAQAGATLEQAAGGPMTAAVAVLTEASSASDAGDVLDSATKHVAEAVAVLRSVLEGLAQRGGFQSLLATTQDLADRQQALELETQDLGTKLVGRRVEALESGAAIELARAARKQDQLADEVEHLLHSLEELQTGGSSYDEATRAVADDALRSGRAFDLVRRERAAATALADNRSAAALLDQRQAERGLRKMVAALQAREKLELAQLQKRLREVQDRVADLVTDQEALRAASTELVERDDAASGWNDLAMEQRRLGRNTKDVADSLADGGDVPVSRVVRAAARAMEEAEQSLSAEEGGAAVNAQAEALARLREALEELEQRAREAAQQWFRRTLADIRDVLQSLRQAQGDVNHGIAELVEVQRLRGAMGREELREVARLARQQVEVQQMHADLKGEVAQVPVFDWALQRVGDWMETSRQRLSDRKLDEALNETVERIVRELDRLLRAIADTESLPTEKEFAEAEMSGGGRASAAGHKPVPTVTELLVLKAMQVDINQRTAQWHEAFDSQSAAEQELRELTELAEDQREVHRLTAMAVQRARKAE